MTTMTTNYGDTRMTTEHPTVPLFRLILSVILPPLGVFLAVGFEARFFINLLLTFLGYIPGLVHAVWVVARTSGSGRRNYA